jgi:hypothetical protein
VGLRTTQVSPCCQCHRGVAQIPENGVEGCTVVEQRLCSVPVLALPKIAGRGWGRDVRH